MKLVAEHATSSPEVRHERLEALRPFADDGYAIANYSIGVAEIAGDGVPRDALTGMRRVRGAASTGLSYAQAHIGAIYVATYGSPEQLLRATRWLRAAAAQGEPSAMGMLATLRLHGLGLEQDTARARVLARRGLALRDQVLLSIFAATSPIEDAETARGMLLGSAPLGHPIVQLNAGLWLLDGIGGPASREQGIVWLEEASRNGSLIAQMTLADLASDTEASSVRSTDWLDNPAAKHFRSLLDAFTGWVYLPTLGDAHSDRRLRLLRRALDSGLEGLGPFLSALDEYPVISTSTLRTLVNAASEGDPEAQLAAAVALLYANVEHPERARATEWIQSAAAAGDSDGRYVLATFLETGAPFAHR